MFELLKKKRPIEAPAEVAGVKVRVSHRARRMALRVDMKAGEVVLTWPRGTSERKALAFIEENQRWIETSRRKLVAPQPFAHGGKISIYGREYEIVRKDGRGLTRLEEAALIVHGRPEHISRRIKDFLKETARDVLTEAAAQKLDQLNLKQTSIRIVDPKTRWGSCGPDGRMMFSWRLILTPPEVLDYVVAHEVAHRVHMNHSRKFWVLCASLTADAAAARKWLKAHGSALMVYQ